MASAVLCLSALSPSAPQAVASADQSTPEAEGFWGPPVDLGVQASHAVLLHTGEVLLYGFPEEHVGSQAMLFDPDTLETVDVSIEYRRDIFCGASSVLADGRVFFTGGTAYSASAEVGTRRTDFFDPLSQSWSQGPEMDFKRWYPSNVELPDGKILIFSGQAKPHQTIEKVEVYDPETNTFATLPDSADRYLDLYPRIHLIPGGKLFVSGRMQRSQVFDPVTNTWSGVSAMFFGDRYSGNSILLPGLRRVLEVGGSNKATGGRTTATSEVIDLGSEAPTWRTSRSMVHARRNANSVALPDGHVLVVGGGQSAYGSAVREAEIYDPFDEEWSPAGTQTAARGYHSIAILLPDGRVLSAGRHHGAFRRTGEIYSPAYLFHGPRPEILSAPDAIGFDQSLRIQTTQADAIERVVLVRPGSVTHGTDFDQRHVELEFEPPEVPGAASIVATGPPDPTHAPPGYYMLFVLNADGVPSEAAWVRLT